MRIAPDELGREVQLSRAVSSTFRLHRLASSAARRIRTNRRTFHRGQYFFSNFLYHLSGVALPVLQIQREVNLTRQP